MEALLAWASAAFLAFLALRQSKAKGGSVLDPMPSGPQPPAHGVPFQSAVRAAASRRSTMSARLIVMTAVHETGNGSGPAFQRTLNAFSIHAVGGHNAYWKSDARNYTTRSNPPEALRGYDSLDDSVSDFDRLLKARYPAAYAAGLRDDAPAFAAALEAGGYSGKGYAQRLLGALPGVRV